MRNIKHMVGVLLSVVCLVVLSGCGGQAEEPVPTVAPAPSAAAGENPLNNAIIDYMNQRDYSIAKAIEIMETYQPEEGQTDYTNLISSLFTPNFRADDELVDLLQLWYNQKRQKQAFI